MLTLLLFASSSTVASYRTSPMKRSTIAAILIAFPIPGLALTIGLYALCSFLFSTEGVGPSVGMAVNLILSVVGLICLAGIFIGIPLGLYLLVTDRQPETEHLPPSPLV